MNQENKNSAMSAGFLSNLLNDAISDDNGSKMPDDGQSDIQKENDGSTDRIEEESEGETPVEHGHDAEDPQEDLPETPAGKPASSRRTSGRRKAKTDNESNADAPKATDDSKTIRFNIVCDKDLADKIRALAYKENYSIRTIVESIFRNAIDKYESKHGRIMKPRQNSLDELF